MEENVAFFTLERTKDKKGVIGAILVTDDLGMPQEFRVTYPVKPTNLQKRLYGDSLLVHIGVTLCGDPLYNALRNKPELLVVSRQRYLPLSTNVSSKVVHIKRTGEAFVIDNDEDDTLLNNVSSKSGRFQPISVVYPPNCNEESKGEINSLIEKYFQGIDLMEPFDRIRGALDTLAEQDDRFQ